MFRLIAVLSVLCLVSGDTDRIVNGRTASANELPFQVSIQERNSHFCGGSIIKNDLILTAAHCLKKYIDENNIDHLSVRAGSAKWKSGGVSKPVAALINHPEYNPHTMKYDVGLIKLLSKLVYSAVIKPIIFAKTLPSPNSCVLVSGWGKLSEQNNILPDIMQAVELSFLTREICSSQIFAYGRSITDSMICAVGPSKDSCQGDSGGPLTICETNTQLGIVSWGAGCAQKGHPGVYTDLTDKRVLAFLEPYVGKL